MNIFNSNLHSLSDSKILIVDDDLLHILFIRTALEEKYILSEAHNGKEAINLIPDLQPDLILLDWNMPEVDGLGVLHFLQNNPSLHHINVIMMTGMMTNLNDLLTAFENGVVDFIKKPFEFPELNARIKSVLELAYFHKQELQKKDQELILNALKKVETIEFINNVFSKLESINSNELIKNIELYKKEFHNIVFENSWKSFEDNFKNLYPGFYSNLIKKHPSLSPAELKLCSLLRLNLSSKEISTILYITPESIKVARSRLRKKLLLDSDANIIGYLMQF